MNRRALDYQVKDVQCKLDEAEQLAVKGGKKVTSRLESKIKDLEGQLDEEQRKLVDAQKSQRRTEREAVSALRMTLIVLFCSALTLKSSTSRGNDLCNSFR